MLHISGIKTTDKRRKSLVEIIESILSCGDSQYVEEIYAKDGVFDKNGFLTDWVALMVELNLSFVNNDLYDTILAIYDLHRDRDFQLIISTEPNALGRGYGTVLWKRGE